MYVSHWYIFLQAEDVEIKQTKTPAPKPTEGSQLKFGHTFSDHMLEVEWNDDTGWGKPKICPVHNLDIHPGAKCLHYAVEVNLVFLNANDGCGGDDDGNDSSCFCIA